MNLNKLLLREAIQLIDSTAGTQHVMRPVEIHLFEDAPSLSPTPLPIPTLPSARERFWDDVIDMSNMLNEEGLYLDYANGTTAYHKAHKIAEVMIQRGVTWASPTKVREAQGLKRKHDSE
jgi:hypothetical protein